MQRTGKQFIIRPSKFDKTHDKCSKKIVLFENFAPIFAKPISARLIGNAAKLHDINYAASSFEQLLSVLKNTIIPIHNDMLFFFFLVFFYKYNEFLVSFPLFGTIRYSSERGVIKMSENISRKSHVVVSEKILPNNRR